MHEAKSLVRNAYSEFLNSFDWDYFATVTFRHDRRDPIAAVRDFWESTAGWEARSFCAVEPHRTGALHIHALMREYPNIKREPERVWSLFFRKFGRSRVEVIRGREDVMNYCSKYVTKDGYHYEFLGRPENWR